MSKYNNCWQLKYIFDLGYAADLVHAVVIVATWSMLRGVEGAHWPDLWLLVMMSALICHLWATLQYHRDNDKSAQNQKRHGRRHTLVVTVWGLTWGCGAFGAASVNDGNEILLFYTMALGGTGLAAVASQYTFLRSCLASLWTSTPLLAMAFILHNRTGNGVYLSIMTFVFAFILTAVAWRMFIGAEQNVRHTWKLEEMVKESRLLTDKLSEQQKKTEKSELEKSKILYQASHDLRQPVHAIRMLVECLCDHPGNPEDKRIIARIDTAARSLSAMISTLLNLSALEAGRLEAKVINISVSAVFERVFRQSDDIARQYDAAIRMVNTAYRVNTDPVLLETMLLNLVSNAVKYGRGNVLVGCRRRGDKLAIEVYDNGDGFTCADGDRIFSEYFRLPEHDGAYLDGNGLGLSIVRRMADLLGFRITVRSQPGRGSRFAITNIPLTDSLPDRQGENTVPAETGKIMPVILIDDDDDNREALHQLLSRWKYPVSSYRKAPDNFPPLTNAILLTELDFSNGVWGMNVARRWLDNGGGPCAVVTGVISRPLQIECQQHNIGLMIKPVEPAQLRSWLLAASVQQQRRQHV